MKKFLILALVLVAGAAVAQEVVPPTTVVPSFDWKVFLQQLMTNGGLVLLAFLVSKIPVVGTYLKTFLDWMMANPPHSTPPTT